MAQLGLELYNRLNAAPGDGGPARGPAPGLRLAAQIAQRLTRPAGGAAGQSTAGLAAQILGRLGGSPAPAPSRSAAPVPGSGSPVLLMRKYEPRPTEAGRRPPRRLPATVDPEDIYTALRPMARSN